MASGDISGALTDFGSAVSDLFGSQAAGASAGSYLQAAAIADQNAKIATASTNTQEMQETRQLYKTLGTQEAQVGGANFAESGTALDLLRDSASQGATAKALTAEQGAITINSYEEQAGIFSGMANAASASGNAQAIGGVLSAAGGALNIYSAAKTAGLFSSGTDAAGNAIFDAGVGAAGAVGDAVAGDTLLSSIGDALFAFA